jgi:hypothetical protein
MTIRFLNSKDGYAKGSVMSNLSVAAQAAYVASSDAEYTAEDQPMVVEPVRRVLGQQGIPCILPGDGTVATNGTITVGVALALTYTQAWVYLPASAVVGGSAGWYYTVFSSTTVGQVYTAYQATMVRPYIPDTLTAAVGSNAAYTQPLGADIVLGTVKIPANLLGANGAVDVHAFTSFLTSANDKITKLKFGASTVVTNTATTTTGISFRKRVQNRGTAKQVIHAVFETGAGVATTASQLAIDTTADVAVTITGQLETAAEYMVLESLCVEVVPSP